MDNGFFTAKVFDLQGESWETIKDEILDLEKEEFQKKAWAESTIKRGFVEDDSTAVLLIEQKTGKIVGFSYAVKGGLDFNLKPVQKEATAYIENTNVDKAYRGKGLVGLIMEKLEEELVKKGYKYVERDAGVKYNYAANIKNHYKEKIVESITHDSKYGKQVFFRIKLV